MKRDEIDALIPADPDRLLRVWAAFMKRGTVGNGYPHKSPGIDSGGINCWDDLESEVDCNTANSVNTIMHDLPNLHYVAISNHYCGGMWIHCGDPLQLLLDGVAEFSKRAKGRGLL